MTWLPRSLPRDRSVPASALGAVEAFFCDGRLAPRLVMMQGQKSRTTEAYLRILYMYSIGLGGISITVQSETFLLSRAWLARTLCRASTGI